MKLIRIKEPITNKIYERKIPDVSDTRQEYYIHLILKGCATRTIFENLIKENKAHIEVTNTKFVPIERYVLNIDNPYEYYKKENEIERQAISDISKIEYEIIDRKDNA